MWAVRATDHRGAISSVAVDDHHATIGPGSVVASTINAAADATADATPPLADEGALTRFEADGVVELEEAQRQVCIDLREGLPQNLPIQRGRRRLGLCGGGCAADEQ